MQVWPKNDQMRKLLKHPSGNIAFRDSGSVEWPNDSFTARRVADGDILLEDPNAAQEKAAQENAQVEQQPQPEENVTANVKEKPARK